MFEKIKPGGVYIVEDLHACYWCHKNGAFDRNSSHDPKAQSATSFFKELIDTINAEHWVHLSQYDLSLRTPSVSKQADANQQFRKSLGTIESIKFSNSMAFITKSKREFSGLGRRIVANREAFVQSSILRYVEN